MSVELGEWLVEVAHALDRALHAEAIDKALQTTRTLIGTDQHELVRIAFDHLCVRSNRDGLTLLTRDPSDNNDASNRFLLRRFSGNVVVSGQDGFNGMLRNRCEKLHEFSSGSREHPTFQRIADEATGEHHHIRSTGDIESLKFLSRARRGIGSTLLLPGPYRRTGSAKSPIPEVADLARLGDSQHVAQQRKNQRDPRRLA